MKLFVVYKSHDLKIGVTDEVNFVDEHGTPTTHEKAVGISHKGVLYNLFGHSEFADAETVALVETDLGTVLEAMVSYSDLAEVINKGVNQVE